MRHFPKVKFWCNSVRHDRNTNLPVEDRINLPFTEYAYLNMTRRLSYIILNFPNSDSSVRNGECDFEKLLFFKLLFHLAIIRLLDVNSKLIVKKCGK